MNTRALSMSSLRPLLPAKVRATSIHVGISLVIFVGLLYLILVEWYPGAFFHTDGGWQGIRLMFAVDVVLGPVLTFVVFNPLKSRREIAMDLSLIGLAQAAALTWGILAVHGQRPVAMVEYQGTFHSVIGEAYTSQGIEISKLKEYDDREPAVIYQRDDGGIEDLLTLFNLKEPWLMFAQVSMYERIGDRLNSLSAHASKFEREITALHPGLADEFRRVRAQQGETTGFLPFQGRYRTVILALTREAEVIDFLPMPE